MDMFEEARTIKGMMEMCKMTQGEIAKKLGVSQSYIGNKIRLLNFSDAAIEKIRDADLTERHARALLRINDEKTLLDTIDKIKDGKFNVAECEALVDAAVEAKAADAIGQARKGERIDMFESFINSSIKNLCAIGITVIKKTCYHKNKRYITISIEDA